MDTRLKPETEKLLQASHDWMLRLEDPRATDEDRRRFQDWLDADPRHRDIYDRAITFREAFGRLSKDDFDDDLRRPSWRERFTAASDRARGLSEAARARAAFADRPPRIGPFRNTPVPDDPGSRRPRFPTTRTRPWP